MAGFLFIVLINLALSYSTASYAHKLGRKKYTWFFISLIVSSPVATLMLWSSNRSFA